MDTSREFCLVMEQLPQKRRFDKLLTNDALSEDQKVALAEKVARAIAKMHKSTSQVDKKHVETYGTFQSIQAKLEENKAYYNLVDKYLREQKTCH